MRPLRVGIDLTAIAASENDPVQFARRVEALGFDFVSASDHPLGDTPTYETWTLLTWVAASTSSIGIASRVLGVPFRLPTMVAKAAETLQRLSGGRLILGLGAGAVDAEIDALGLDVLSPGDKIRALEEAVAIIQGLWSQPDFTYPGRHHASRAATITPPPPAPIPVWLGTFGDRALELTGRVADGWIPSLGHAPVHRLGAMRARVAAATAASGRQPDAVECILNVEIGAGRSRAAADHVIVGDPPEMTKRLKDVVDLGFDGFNLIVADPSANELLDHLAHDIIPALRAHHKTSRQPPEAAPSPPNRM